jgi:hypothetical protein
MTAAEYKFVYFSPDPFIGSKVPVAALLRTSEGVQAVPANTLNAACIGGSDVEFLVRAALRNLERATNLDQLPLSLGPHFTLASDVRTIPSKVGEPGAWLASVLAPPPASRPKRGPRVASEGRELFQRWGVSSYVSDHFRPRGNVLSMFAERLEPITHYVFGRELLLLEPIPVTASKDKIIKISTRFGAYRQALEKQPPDLPWRLISYVLPPKDSKRVCDGLEARVAFADAVLNTSDPEQRHALVQEIQTAAAA